jgi:DNA-binding GntR family transcriptional regulator
MQQVQKQTLADSVYEQIRAEFFEFRLLPGDHFSEIEIAQRTGASRTPVRQALYRLQREGFLNVRPRSGWVVRPLDFEQLDALYELRVVLEQAAVRRLSELPDKTLKDHLSALDARWLVPAAKRSTDAAQVAAWDEEFHCDLVAAGGNPEMARVHWDVTERIRVVRRLDFTQAERILATYREHATMLRGLRQHRFEDVAKALAIHIELSRIAARKITMYRLQRAQQESTQKISYPAPFFVAGKRRSANVSA